MILIANKINYVSELILSDGYRGVVSMAKVLIVIVLCAICAQLCVSVVLATPLLDANEIGFNGQTRNNNYDALIDAYFSNGNVVTSINNNLLWVPWFTTSSSSQVTDLQKGANCNSGQAIDFSHNCMVTDEFSQIGVLVSMGKDQTRMNQFYNTVIASKSTNGNIPGWRIYRNGNTLEPCKQGINNNCDTASDATARIIIALFTASKNPYLSDAAQKTNYANLAKKLADDMLTYEVDNSCRPTRFGTVCHWLAGGSNAKKAGITTTDFAYTGYYPDAIIAMLETYANTNNSIYYDAAKDFTLNYLQAANFNNQAFSVPPGKSFKWTIDTNGAPKATCTNTCSPVVWDGYDASRALSMCQANYYAKAIGVQLPNLQKYCDLLTQKYMSSTASAPIQFYPNGDAMPPQSGCFAQGLEALHFSGVNSAMFKSSLDSALSHYVPSTKTFDYSPSIGVYTQSFAIRALGMGIGRDLNAFKATPASSVPAQGIAGLKAYCTYGTANTQATVKSDITSGGCRTIVYSTSTGDIKMLACEKDQGYVEIYQQSAPSGMVFKACLANGYISNDNGFARFIPTTTVTATPTPTYKGITSLSVSCTYNSVAGKIKSDLTSGTCRTVVFSTTNGDVQIQGCEKTGGYIEVYRQSCPNNFAFKACMGAGCVDNNGGYAKFLA